MFWNQKSSRYHILTIFYVKIDLIKNRQKSMKTYSKSIILTTAHDFWSYILLKMSYFEEIHSDTNVQTLLLTQNWWFLNQEKIEAIYFSKMSSLGMGALMGAFCIKPNCSMKMVIFEAIYTYTVKMRIYSVSIMLRKKAPIKAPINSNLKHVINLIFTHLALILCVFLYFLQFFSDDRGLKPL